jgi:hypothetical protein
MLLLPLLFLLFLLLLPQCMESQYINSRPFRINAGAVHAYVQAPNGRTAYLSELHRSAAVQQQAWLSAKLPGSFVHWMWWSITSTSDTWLIHG